MSPRRSPQTSRPDDTEKPAHARQIEAYRRMSGGERVAIAFRLNEWARRNAEGGIRSRHPDYSEAEVKMALRRLWLGDELTRQAWPDRELVEP